jgi:hypothetical protein
MSRNTIWAALMFAISMSACYAGRPDAVYVGHDHRDGDHHDGDHHDGDHHEERR